MKINLNKSTKRALSLVLAFAMLIGSLFTANVGVNIAADAETDTEILVWNNNCVQPTDKDSDGAILIKTAEQFAWVCQKSGSSGAGVTYRVQDGIKAIVMQPSADIMSYDNSADVQAWFENESNTKYTWTPAEFYGTLDGNGATVYGFYNSTASGMFSALNGTKTETGTAVKNIAVKNSYFSATSDQAGILANTGKWGTQNGPITIANCVLEDNYFSSTGGQTGIFIGNSGETVTLMSNCLVADNTIIKNGAENTFLSFVNTINETPTATSSITCCIGIGAKPQIGTVGGSKGGTSSNCFSDQYYEYTGVTYLSSLSEVWGVNAKAALKEEAGFDWAVQGDTSHGKWYVDANGYPTPYYPGSDWTDIILADVWSGNTADFTKGSGTENDPYIIENPDQLYKMVKDGGRLSDGETPAYYKVSDAVDDLYLNAVQCGTLDTLKGLVSAGTAKNWTKNYHTTNNHRIDKDSDGKYDEASAFIGVFDGNGVTIHGLYSTTNDSTYTRDGWTTCSGIGFVPALTGNAIIKNVTFDKSYIYDNKGYNAAVLTTSFGLDDSNAKYYGKCYVSIYNVAVRNSHIETTSTYESVDFGSSAGLVASHTQPKKAVFVNCLFDGYSSELVHARSTYDHRGGIFSCTKSGAQLHLISCVSLGYTPMPNDSTIGFSHIPGTQDIITFTDTYTDISIDSGYAFAEGKAPIKVETAKTAYETSDMPNLNWSQWSIVEVEDGRKIPMPTAVTSCNAAGYTSYKDMVLSQVGSAGNYTYSGAQKNGVYGHYQKLVGSGTVEDPYLISTALELANAIGTGAVNVNQRLYYKLTNDIDLGGLKWIDDVNVKSDTEDYNRYTYVSFKGVLDGDGYAIYGLSTIATGALIPTLDGGTVKNLHIRNSASSSALIAANVISGTIEGCSAEDCYLANNSGNAFVGAGAATIKNSYYDDTYYLSDGNTGTPTPDGVIWYQGGGSGCAPKLVNRAKAMPCADIDGDGNGFEYTPADLAALKSRLLKKSAYAYAYGDVTKDGNVNSADLAILGRVVSEDYNHVKDGFWRNLQLGNISIYYGENDNYDAARRLELYLEAAVPGLDVKKVVSAASTVSGSSYSNSAVYVHANDNVGTPDGKLEIIVGNIANYSDYAANDVAKNANTYAVTYDKEKAVLWLQGENFTAVEQAVLDFVNKSDFASNVVYTTTDDAELTNGFATLSAEKVPVQIDTDGDGTKDTWYYYTWGDEFDGTELNEDNWDYRKMSTETSYESGTAEGKYLNLEFAFNEDLSKLYTVEGGKLTMRRGTYAEGDYSWGYVGLDKKTGQNQIGDNIDEEDIYVSAGNMVSERSMLVKQGYFEFKAALPSDGHSFMSWWMLGAPAGGNNNAYTESLFGKIYKLNPNYLGQNRMDGNNPKETYKYQVPNSYFEIDIIELMQDITNFEDITYYSGYWDADSVNFRTGVNSVGDTTLGLKGIYDYDLPFNLHKYFDTGVNSVNPYYYAYTWSEDGVPTAVFEDGYTANGSDNTQDGIMSTTLGSHNFGNTTAKYYYWKNSSYGQHEMNSMEYSAAAHKKLTAMRRYGFLWKVTDSNNDGVGDAFSYTVYIYDPDGDGEADANDYKAYTFTDMTYNEAKNSSDTLWALDAALDDAEIANQYMYFLIDSTYYTANQYYNGSTITQFTDLLKQDNTDKTTLEIDYVRVYQADGRRDIITPETEAFNNGNHFGY